MIPVVKMLVVVAETILVVSIFIFSKVPQAADIATALESRHIESFFEQVFDRHNSQSTYPAVTISLFWSFILHSQQKHD